MADTFFLSASFLCVSQESSSAASAAREGLFSPRTWPGWIPVTSTGMRNQERKPCSIGRWGR
ncbi:hypothetical protein CN238_08230 [Sinorhizobium meliloti]|nr:hypothetical protein CN238_08230 [Sinorhizobium meliloti]RVH33223.1 hypothetical protein CN214_08835 [Sinorhizobium meliloti]RVH36521.1 hypothetical protein CN211_10670 [Sinorhizobium meliloti]